MSTTHLAPYLLFAGKDYYAAPGWDCFRGAYLTQEDASRALHEKRIPFRPEHTWETIQWYQIVDLRRLSVVEHGGWAHAGDERPEPREFKGYTLEAPETT